jgi:hypothetical protein
MKFTIPTTVEDAGKQLADLDGLITARSWQRAAIVYAFTEPPGQGARTSRNSAKLTPSAFAKLGIAGLRNAETVRTYHGHWQYAIDQGKAQPVAPGDVFHEPDLDFPPTGKSRGRLDLTGSTTATEKAAAIDELLDDADVARQVSPAKLARQASRPDVARAIARNDAAREAVEDEAIEVRATQRIEAPPLDPDRAGRRMERAIARRLDQDAVVEHLRDAYEEAVEALAHFNDAGTTDEAGVHYWIARTRHIFDALEGRDEVLTDEDREFLNTIGAK